MNVLFVGYASPHVYRPIRFLLDSGHKVCMASYRGDPMEGERHPSYSCISVPDTIERTSEFVLALQMAKKVFKPDVIHVHYADYQAWQCSLMPVAPMVISVWGSDINRQVGLDEQGAPMALPGYEAIVEEAMRKAAAVIVDDPVMIRKVDFMTGGSVPITLAHLGADDVFFEDDPRGRAALRRKLELPEGVPLIVSARAFSEFYRHEDIVDAFSLVAEQRDAVLLFKTFTANGWNPSADTASDARFDPRKSAEASYLRAVQKRATHRGVWRKVRFCGSLSLPDLRNLYALADVVVNMPTRDAFPVTFVEAAACGAKVVTCWHPAYDVPLVKNHFNILAESTPEAMARSLLEVLDNPPTAEYRQAAREEARTHWKHESYGRKLLRVYHEAARGA